MRPENTVPSVPDFRDRLASGGSGDLHDHVSALTGDQDSVILVYMEFMLSIPAWKRDRCILHGLNHGFIRLLCIPADSVFVSICSRCGILTAMELNIIDPVSAPILILFITEAAGKNVGRDSGQGIRQVELTLVVELAEEPVIQSDDSFRNIEHAVHAPGDFQDRIPAPACQHSCRLRVTSVGRTDPETTKVQAVKGLAADLLHILSYIYLFNRSILSGIKRIISKRFIGSEGSGAYIFQTIRQIDLRKIITAEKGARFNPFQRRGHTDGLQLYFRITTIDDSISGKSRVSDLLCSFGNRIGPAMVYGIVKQHRPIRVEEHAIDRSDPLSLSVGIPVNQDLLQIFTLIKQIGICLLNT